jgi:hypothetical protein
VQTVGERERSGKSLICHAVPMFAVDRPAWHLPGWVWLNNGAEILIS